MTQYILALILLGCALLLIALQKTYYFFPVRELKRQARAGDREARALYRAVAYGSSLRLLLWLAIGLTVAGSYALLAAVAPGWLVFLAVASLIWYAFAWAPHAPITGFGAGLVLFVTPAIVWVLYYAHPFLDWFNRTIQRFRSVTFHTGLFERDDLVELINDQRILADSRIPHADLDLVLHALTFGDKTVQSTMVPLEKVKSVKETDVIGPILMDELYESKHSRFPVIDNSGAVIGTLFLRDLVSMKQGGSVRSTMKQGLSYVHEDQTLHQVLHAFLSTKHHLFVVIDSAERYVGIITIEDVLEQIIGHKIEDDFDSYDDKRAVVSAHSRSAAKSAKADTAATADDEPAAVGDMEAVSEPTPENT